MSPVLDNAVRLLREKSVGVLLVSRKLSDSDSLMRSAMETSMLFMTNSEGNLRATAEMLGPDASEIIPKLPVGYSVFHLKDLGDPLKIAWRPTCSEPPKMPLRFSGLMRRLLSWPRPVP